MNFIEYGKKNSQKQLKIVNKLAETFKNYQNNQFGSGSVHGTGIKYARYGYSSPKQFWFHRPRHHITVIKGSNLKRLCSGLGIEPIAKFSNLFKDFEFRRAFSKCPYYLRRFDMKDLLQPPVKHPPSPGYLHTQLQVTYKGLLQIRGTIADSDLLF